MSDIVSPRLILRLLPIEALDAAATGDLLSVSKLIGTYAPSSWSELAWVAALRREQIKADPAYFPWSIRAIILSASNEVVGYINFHEKPGRHAFAETDNTVEFGYAIEPARRRRGYAEEAVQRLMDWAQEHGARNFVFSISPENAASLALARKLGARKIGTQIDEKDGPEDVHLLTRV